MFKPIVIFTLLLIFVPAFYEMDWQSQRTTNNAVMSVAQETIRQNLDVASNRAVLMENPADQICEGIYCIDFLAAPGMCNSGEFYDLHADPPRCHEVFNGIDASK